MASDQDAGRRGVFVDFLGRPASTPSGPVELALATGAPIVFGTIHRVAIDRHVVRLRPPVWPERDRDREETVLRYSQLFAGWLEEAIRGDADHWFWLHRRWKTRPESPSGAPARQPRRRSDTGPFRRRTPPRFGRLTPRRRRLY
jgi:KDO2-lipid IV(A) lauroyltransferase